MKKERMNLLLDADLKSALEDLARIDAKSLNQFVVDALLDLPEKRADDLKKYRDLLSEIRGKNQ